MDNIEIKKKIFLIGTKISHSPSPAIQNQWFLDHQIHADYSLLPLNSENEFLRAVEALLKQKNFCGANITAPFKNILMDSELLRKTTIAKKTGTMNTLYHSENIWWIDNTDVIGIERTFKKLQMDTEESVTAILVGGGATARSALFCLRQISQCKKIYALTRNPNQVKDLKVEKFTSEALSSNSSCLLVINCTPLGHFQEHNPLAEEIFNFQKQSHIHFQRKIFFDVVYSATPAMRCAEKLGFETIDGKLMLIEQAKASFERWTGIDQSELISPMAL